MQMFANKKRYSGDRFTYDSFVQLSHLSTTIMLPVYQDSRPKWSWNWKAHQYGESQIQKQKSNFTNVEKLTTFL